jgi:hypothetical protein
MNLPCDYIIFLFPPLSVSSVLPLSGNYEALDMLLDLGNLATIYLPVLEKPVIFSVE